MNMIN